MNTLAALEAQLQAHGTPYDLERDVEVSVNYPRLETVRAVTAVYVRHPGATRGPLLAYDADGVLIGTGRWSV